MTSTLGVAILVPDRIVKLRTAVEIVLTISAVVCGGLGFFVLPEGLYRSAAFYVGGTCAAVLWILGTLKKPPAS